MREDNGDKAHRVFEMPTNDLDFDDFHPYPLTFRDALSTHDVPHLSHDYKSVVPVDFDSSHDEVNAKDKNAESERSETDSGNVSAEGAEFPTKARNPSNGHSGREPGGSDVRGAAGNGIGSGSSANDGLGSHEVHDGHPEDISADDADSNDG